MRVTKILETVWRINKNDQGTLNYQATDLDANATCFILTDAIEPKKELKWDSKPFSSLMTNLVSYLARSLPSITLKCGNSAKLTLGELGKAMSGLDVALNSAQGGNPVLFLDVRERPLVEGVSQMAIINAAKEKYEEFATNSRKWASRTPSTCAIAYFREILNSDKHFSVVHTPRGRRRQGRRTAARRLCRSARRSSWRRTTRSSMRRTWHVTCTPTRSAIS